MAPASIMGYYHLAIYTDPGVDHECQVRIYGITLIIGMTLIHIGDRGPRARRVRKTDESMENCPPLPETAPATGCLTCT